MSPRKSAQEEAPPAQETPNKRGGRAFDSASASKAAKARHERDRARKAAAAVKQAEEEERLRKAAGDAEATRLARLAVEADTKRMVLRHLWTEKALALLEAVDPGRLRRVRLAGNGDPILVERSYIDRRGALVTISEPAIDGDLEAKDLRELTVAAAVALDKVRLEEGSPTARAEVLGLGAGFTDAPAERLDDLITRAADTLRLVDEVDPL